jgi:hypothetical protein
MLYLLCGARVSSGGRSLAPKISEGRDAWRRSMARHTKEQREFILLHVARYYTHDDICVRFVSRWPDTACKPADVARLDPQYALLGPEESVLYQAERTRVNENPEQIAPSLLKSVRLVKLHHMAETARARGSYDLAAKLYAQIAAELDESGGKGPFGRGATGATPEVKTITVTRTIVDPTVPT